MNQVEPENKRNQSESNIYYVSIWMIYYGSKDIKCQVISSAKSL